jgi:hypothetical protein
MAKYYMKFSCNLPKTDQVRDFSGTKIPLRRLIPAFKVEHAFIEHRVSLREFDHIASIFGECANLFPIKICHTSGDVITDTPCGQNAARLPGDE